MPANPTPAVMIQGAGSSVGKSLIVAGLCRLLRRRGLRVAPFKPQNMSNNAAVAEGGEIGRAQALQARAAGLAPSVDMNPVLLKPEGERGAQVVVAGRPWRRMSAREYATAKAGLLPRVLESFARLAAAFDLVLVEGAGSPAETNLRAGDIANMGFAAAAGLPVVLVGDIERGGVIAQMVGTHAVLDDADRRRIKGFLVNRFRGDPSLFAEGMAEIARRTGWAALGLVPHFADAHLLPAEDSADLAARHRDGAGGRVRVAVPRLPRIANFDDLDPLRAEPGLDVELIEPGRALPGDADLVLLPGSKATIADLAALRATGWDIDIAAHARRGGRVLGVCGGYQMLGTAIFDPDGAEGAPGTAPGLGLLAVETVLAGDKAARPAAGRHLASGEALAGYEIHIGRTTGPDTARPFAEVGGAPEGAVSPDGRIAGTYLHGIFAGDGFRRAFLRGLGAAGDPDLAFEARIEAALDGLAGHLEAHVEVDRLLAIAGLKRPAHLPPS